MSEIHLFQRYPALQESIPRVGLGDFPTPVDRWKDLARQVGLESLWVKRDDQSAPDFGGNKVRCLEFVLGGALGSRRPLLVCAPVGSSWAAACAYYGRTRGAEVDLVLFRRPAPVVREPNASVMATYGRDRIHTASAAWMPLRVLIHLLFRRGERPRILPAGGSSSSGSLGYLNAVLEMDAQVREGLLPRPDVIYVPLGSGGTAAGLLAGISLLRWETRLVAVRVSTPWIANRQIPGRVARGALRLLRRGGAGCHPVRTDLLEVEGGFYGGRYGRPIPSGREAADRVMEAQGIELDQTYTAKTVAALIARARDGGLRGRNVLYVHTYNSRNLHLLLEG